MPISNHFLLIHPTPPWATIYQTVSVNLLFGEPNTPSGRVILSPEPNISCMLIVMYISVSPTRVSVLIPQSYSGSIVERLHMK